VIIADDFPFGVPAQNPDYELLPNNPTANPPYLVGALNGRIFRLGSYVGSSTVNGGAVYNLDPAYGMRPTPSNGGVESPDTVPSQAMLTAAGASAGSYGGGQFRVKVFMVGAGQLNGGAYTGTAQDIGVFATYFPVK
jgi:hypothetical protein